MFFSYFEICIVNTAIFLFVVVVYFNQFFSSLLSLCILNALHSKYALNEQQLKLLFKLLPRFGYWKIVVSSFSIARERSFTRKIKCGPVYAGEQWEESQVIRNLQWFSFKFFFNIQSILTFHCKDSISIGNMNKSNGIEPLHLILGISL